jgi:glycosyltransferase involved in cell wall biosynthesis
MRLPHGPNTMLREDSHRTTDHSRPWLLVSAAFVRTGGQDRANLALASFLARQNCPLHIVAHRVADDLGIARSVVVHPAPRPIGSDLLGEPFLQWLGTRWASRLGDARVIVNGGNCTWPDVNWVHYVHAAYDADGHGGVLRQAKGYLAHRRWLADEKKALLRARLVIANSNRTARDLMERVGVPPDRIRVVYYGIDPEQFRPADPGERAEARTAFGWPVDRPVALFIGGLGDRRKGFDTLFSAWRMLARKGGARPLLAVIGRGAQLPEWQRRAADEGLSDTIAFLGFRKDVPRLARAADLLIAPARYEAYGLGVHEALCCGLPAIVSAGAGVAERYPFELGDLLVPGADDARALAARIEWCLGKPSGLASAMAAFAARLRQRTWDHMAADITAAVTAS